METERTRQAGPYQLFMLALCAFVLILLAIDVVLPLSDDAKTIILYVDSGICVIFLADFSIGLARADRKLAFLKWGWIDLVSSIPAVGVLRISRASHRRFPPEAQSDTGTAAPSETPKNRVLFSPFDS